MALAASKLHRGRELYHGPVQQTETHRLRIQRVDLGRKQQLSRRVAAEAGLNALLVRQGRLVQMFVAARAWWAIFVLLLFQWSRSSCHAAGSAAVGSAYVASRIGRMSPGKRDRCRPRHCWSERSST